MNAIEWMDARTKSLGKEIITISAEEADFPEEVGTYETEVFCFTGVIPYRMRKEAFQLLHSCPQNNEIRVNIVTNKKTDVTEYFKHITRKVGA